MKNLKKFSAKTIRNASAVKGGNNTNPLLEDMDPTLLENILQNNRLR